MELEDIMLKELSQNREKSSTYFPQVSNVSNMHSTNYKRMETVRGCGDRERIVVGTQSQAKWVSCHKGGYSL